MTFKLEKLEKAKLKEWISETGGSYDILIRLLAQYSTDKKIGDITGDNEFQQLRDLHQTQGKVAGVTEFFDDIERDIA